MSTMTFPAYAGAEETVSHKPSLFQRLALAMADSRRRKAQRQLNERMAFYGPTLLEASGMSRISLENDDLLPLK